jgi:hypothetical protein
MASGVQTLKCKLRRTDTQTRAVQISIVSRKQQRLWSITAIA